MSVLIDQDHIQDLLVALENSPMAIQVIDFEMSKPSTRVVKPVKGESMNFARLMAARIRMMRMGAFRQTSAGRRHEEVRRLGLRHDCRRMGHDSMTARYSSVWR